MSPSGFTINGLIVGGLPSPSTNHAQIMRTRICLCSRGWEGMDLEAACQCCFSLLLLQRWWGTCVQKSSWNTQASAGYRVGFVVQKGLSVFFLFWGAGRGSVFSPDWLLTITLWGQGHFMSSYTVFICPARLRTYVRPDPCTSHISVGLPP